MTDAISAERRLRELCEQYGEAELYLERARSGIHGRMSVEEVELLRRALLRRIAALEDEAARIAAERGAG